MEVNAQYVIESLLEQNRQLTLQISMLEAALKPYMADTEHEEEQPND